MTDLLNTSGWMEAELRDGDELIGYECPICKKQTHNVARGPKIILQHLSEQHNAVA